MEFYDITAAGLAQLHAEVAALQKERPHRIAVLQAARALGDLSENADYSAAKRDLRHLESRLRYLDRLIRHAQVVETPSGDEVAIGKVVTVAFMDPDADLGAGAAGGGDAGTDAAAGTDADEQTDAAAPDAGTTAASAVNGVPTPTETAAAAARVAAALAATAPEDVVTYRLVGRHEASMAPENLAVDSPLGQAILHRRVGDRVLVAAPAGTYPVVVTRIADSMV
ncbi:transcription elongation factor GreA [Lacticaseibacillus kribbianus]|uniref:transcription elongation factor GreA n=1 Tax=Lacticaseibacillus kribbianus TaxID=2926292 RepID=UPI00237CE3B9|nr:transcription elongation factor GreA [Lacticaseibacillus kribbianus]